MWRRIWESVYHAPYPMWTALGCMVAGVLQFAFWEFSPFLTALGGVHTAVIWAAYLAGGGAVTIWGYASHQTSYEILGLRLMALAHISYSVALWAHGGVGLSVSALLNLTLGLAHLTRGYSLRRAQRRREWIRNSSDSSSKDS